MLSNKKITVLGLLPVLAILAIPTLAQNINDNTCESLDITDSEQKLANCISNMLLFQDTQSNILLIDFHGIKDSIRQSDEPDSSTKTDSKVSDVLKINQINNSSSIAKTNSKIEMIEDGFELAVEENFKEEYSDEYIIGIEDYNQKDFYGYADVSVSRQKIVNTALAMEGKIRYTWGGKASGPGWNDEWSDNQGLDCSGFVQWVLWTCGVSDYNRYGSTKDISINATEIAEEDLKPGDLGLKFKGGSSSSTTNHVGIYVGLDENGNKQWIHCTTGSYYTVVKDNFDGFTYFCRYLSTE